MASFVHHPPTHFWQGRLRSCESCRQRGRKCIYHPRKPSCERCLSYNIRCSGPTEPLSFLKAANKTPTLKVNIAPSSARGRLDSFTLSCALTYHLVLDGMGQFGQAVATGVASPWATHFLDLQQRFLTSGGNLSALPELLEILCLRSMCSAARFTTHSAIVGHRVSSMLPKSGPIGDVNVDFDISQVGLLRIPLYEVLVRKLRGHIENLTREVATMSLEEAVTIFEFLAISMNITYSFGVLSVVDIVGIRRSFNPSLATLLARTSRTGQDREFIETYSSNQEEDERFFLLQLEISPLRSKIHLPTLPELYALTTEDIDVLLAFQDRVDNYLRQERVYEINRSFIRSSSRHYSALNLRAEVHATDNTRPVAADLVWYDCEIKFNHIDRELSKMMDDYRYQGPIFPDAPNRLITVSSHGMADNATIALIFQRWGADSALYTSRAMILLSRVSNLWSTLERLRGPDSLGIRVKAFYQPLDVVKEAGPEILKLWCIRFPIEAKRLLHGAKIVSFSYPPAAHLCEIMEETLATSEGDPSATTRTSKLAFDMVEGALMEIQATTMVEKTLSEISS